MEPLAIYYAGYEKCQSRHSYGPAIRSQYLVHYILSGKGLFRRGTQTYHLEANSMFLICPEELTYYEADAQDPWEYCWVGFHGTDARPLMEACGLLDRPVRSDLPAEARSTVLRLYQAHGANHGSPILCKGLLYQFFSCVETPAAHRRPVTADEYLSKATEYIRRNYMYDISISGVSSYVGIDRSYLYRLFMQWEGVSPRKYLLEHRMEAARRMLLGSGHTVTEIAYSCGFWDVSSFDKAFRKATGQAPRSYRQSGGKP